MLRFYLSLFRGVPGLFRQDAEGWVFWAWAAMTVVTWIWPHVERWQQDAPLPPWFGPASFGLLIVAALLRVNYSRYKAKSERVEQLEALPTEAYALTVQFRSHLIALNEQHGRIGNSAEGIVWMSDMAHWWRQLEQYKDRFPAHEWLELQRNYEGDMTAQDAAWNTQHFLHGLASRFQPDHLPVPKSKG